VIPCGVVAALSCLRMHRARGGRGSQSLSEFWGGDNGIHLLRQLRVRTLGGRCNCKACQCSTIGVRKHTIIGLFNQHNRRSAKGTGGMVRYFQYGAMLPSRAAQTGRTRGWRNAVD
jgi:hypothetical protein